MADITLRATTMAITKFLSSVFGWRMFRRLGLMVGYESFKEVKSTYHHIYSTYKASMNHNGRLTMGWMQSMESVSIILQVQTTYVKIVFGRQIRWPCAEVCFTEDGSNPSPQYMRDISEVLCEFMSDINVTLVYYPTSKVTYDSDFSQSCCEVELRNLVKPEIVQSQEFQLALQGAVAFVMTVYAHLENVSTRQWICLYTTRWEISCESQHWLGQLNHTIASFTLTIWQKRTLRLYESSMHVFVSSNRPQMH